MMPFHYFEIEAGYRRTSLIADVRKAQLGPRVGLERSIPMRVNSEFWRMRTKVIGQGKLARGAAA
jgi:hypothetical protein